MDRLIFLLIIFLVGCTDLGTNMASKESKYYTSIVIDLSEVKTSHEGVENFVIAVYKGTQTIDENIVFDRNITVEAEFVQEKFVYKPVDNVVIKDCEYNCYYYFRIKHDKEDSFGKMWSERAGDNTNELLFDSNEKYVTYFDDFIKVKQKLNDIPDDIDRFEVYITTQTFTDIYESEPTDKLEDSGDYPAENAVPNLVIPFGNVSGDYLIFSIDDINELEWKHIWVKAIDNSGNVDETTGKTNGWFKVGYGRRKAPQDEAVIIDGSFEATYYNEGQLATLLQYWTSDINDGRIANYLQSIEPGIAGRVPPISGINILSLEAGETIYNKRLVFVDNTKIYSLEFYAAYDVYSIIGDDEWNISINQYDKNGNEIPSSRIELIDNKISSSIPNEAVWVKFKEKLSVLETTTKYIRIELTSDVHNIYFDNIKLSINQKAKDIQSGTFPGTMTAPEYISNKVTTELITKVILEKTLSTSEDEPDVGGLSYLEIDGTGDVINFLNGTLGQRLVVSNVGSASRIIENNGDISNYSGADLSLSPLKAVEYIYRSDNTWKQIGS